MKKESHLKDEEALARCGKAKPVDALCSVHGSLRGLFLQVVFLCGIFGLSKPVQAQTETYPFNFAYLSKDNGLPHNYCHTALRDHRGFLWFGTQDGLARYDGVAFKVYSYRDDSTGLSAPTVLDLDEDRRGYLWIATVGGGLNRFDPVTETFTWYQNDPRDSTTLPGNDLTNVLIDTDGSIWIGGLSSGLSRLDPATGRCVNFSLAQELTTAEDRLNRNSVQDIAVDSENEDLLWLATNDGVFRFEKHSGRLQHYPAQVPCRDVQAEKPGILWVATDGGGIARFDKKSAQWAYFPSRPEEWARRNFTTNQISDISWKSDREIWVASLDQGFGIFNIETGKYTFFNSQAKLLAGQAQQSVNGLYRDPTGLLWVFNYKNGVSLLDPASNILEYTPMPTEGCQNANANTPLDFAWNDARKELYVVSSGCRGLYVFEPVERMQPTQLSGQSPYRFKYSVTPPGGKTVLFQCIQTDWQGRVWIGADPKAGGYSLYLYTPETKTLRPFMPGAAFHRYPVNALQRFEKGMTGGDALWLATTGGGLFDINIRTQAVQQYIKGDDFDGTRTQVVDLFCQGVPDGSNSGIAYYRPRVWCATREAGVFCLDSAKFIHYQYQPGSRKGLAENEINAIIGDPEGTIWVGTASQGLQMIPRDAGPNAIFPRYTVKDGLAFNSIHGLELTTGGGLSVSTEKGISTFFPGTRKFETYDESDGLADTYLHHKRLRTGANGDLFIGQTKGFYALHTNQSYQNDVSPVLAFTGFQVFGKPYPTGKDLNFQPVVRLTHDRNFFTIQFAALNFSQSNRNQYEHLLEGIDPGWVHTGNRAEASYTQVPPGSYRFRVRAWNNSGAPSQNELDLRIVIEPAFYQTWWFRSLLLGLFIGAVVWYFRERLDRILKQAAAKNELSRLRAVKAELENKALRSQMNPHFIFNALNTIEALIVEENPDAASALLQKFSKLVRLMLENSQYASVSLDLELEALELYIQLEAIRLDGRFRYQIQVDPRLEQQRCEIPPMILQPFVENAILHGLRHLRDREGMLQVRIEPVEAGGEGQHKRFLKCLIEDNGIGRAEAAVINARNRIAGKKQSLGIKLTLDRVELLNEPGKADYRVEISDLSGNRQTGTRVSLILPLEFKNGNHPGPEMPPEAL